MKEILLTQGKVALVDNEDYEKLSKIRWFAARNGNTFYAVINKWYADQKRQRLVSMHRFVMSPPVDMQVDHINGDGLDNRKENLRICTNAENRRNGRISKNNNSGYKGVYWCKSKSRWKAQIKFNGFILQIGYFKNILDAVHAYDSKARELHGEFASPNLP